MAPETLIFMPNGDVTLTLTRHILEEEDPETAIEDEQPQNGPGIEPEAPVEPEEPEEDVLFYAPDAPDSETFYPPPRRAARGSDASSRRDRSTSPPASFWASLKRQQAKMGEPSEGEKPATETKPAKKERVVLSSHEVYCIVSSRHMMLASRYFESLLSGNSKEAVMLRNKRQVSIPLSADLDAMIILLNIVHGVSRKVPRQVKLDTLSKLAMLVSVFGMIDAVQFFSDTWIDDFQRRGLPQAYNDQVLSLLFVFWVFDRPVEFKNMTRITQRECDENLDEDAQEVPIPRSIIDAIKRDREFAMESAIAVIHTLINKYLDGQTICDGAWEEEFAYACDATVLGSLMKSSRKIGIWPKPEAPFPGKKFKNLAQAIRSIKVLDVCKKSSSRRLHLLGPSNNSHGLEDSIEAAMKGIEAGMDGLELAEYAKKSDDFSEIFVPAHSSDALNEQTNGNMEEDLPLYMREEVDPPRREFSVSLPAVSVRTGARDVEEPARNGLSIASRQYSRESVKSERPVFARGSVPEARRSIRENGDAVSRDSWSHELKNHVYEEEKVIPRNSWSQQVKAPVHEHAEATSRDTRTQEPINPVHEQTRVVPRNSWYNSGEEHDMDQPKAISRNSWNHEEIESVIEQRKTSPTDSWGQGWRQSSSVTARSPIEPHKDDSRASVDRRPNSNTSFPREEIKPPAEESYTAPRNSSTEQVKAQALADRALHRTPSFHKMRTDEVQSQQPVVAPRVPSTERVTVLADRKLSLTTSYPREEVKTALQQPPVATRVSAAQEARVLADKRPNATNPFTNSSKNDSKSTLSQQPAVSRLASTEEKTNGDRKPNTTNPFNKTPNNESKSPLQPPAVAPRVPSREEVAALTNKKLSTTSVFQIPSKDDVKPSVTPRTSSPETVPKAKELSRPEKEEAKTATTEVRTASSDALTTTEDEEAVVVPQKFNMRKSKKKFQAKY